MPLPLITRRRQLSAVLETVSGTIETPPVGITSFDAFDLTVSYEVSSVQHEGSGLYGASRVVSGARSATIEFSTYLFGASGEALFDALMPACRWADAGGGVWTPADEADESSVPTASLFVYEDGRLRSFAGCAGTFRITRAAGEPDVVRWTFRGADSSIAAATFPAITRALAGILPSKYAGGAQSVLGQSPIVHSAEFDAGSVLAPRDSAAVAGGLLGFRVVGHTPTLEIEAEDQLSSWLPESSMRTDTPGAVSLAGSLASIGFASAGVAAVSPTDRNGLVSSRVRLVPIRVDDSTPLASITLS